MPQVAEVMARVTVSPWASGRQAARLPVEHPIGSLPLEDGALRGQPGPKGGPPQPLVAGAMRPHPLAVPPGMDLLEAARLVRKWRVERRLVAGGRLFRLTQQALAFALGQRLDTPWRWRGWKAREGSPARGAGDPIRLSDPASTRAKAAPTGPAEDGRRARARAPEGG